MHKAKFISFLMSILLVLFTLPLRTIGQSLKQYVPASSTFVLGVNWSTLESKLSFSEINDAKSFLGDDDPFMDLFVKILDNPKLFGLDLKEQTYLYFDQGDTFQNKVVLLALSNRSTFVNKVEEWLHLTDAKASFKKSGAMHQYSKGTLAVSCTNDMAIVLIGQDKYFSSSQYSYGNDFNYWRERRKVIRQIDSMRYSGNDPYADVMAAEEDDIDIETMEVDEMDMPVEVVEDDDVEMDDVVEIESNDAYDEELEIAVYEEYDDDEEEIVAYEVYDDDDYDDYEVVAEAIEDVEDRSDNYDYDKHPLMKALNAKRDAFEKKAQDEHDKMVAVSTMNEAKRYLKLDLSETYAKNARFNSIMTNEHDLTFWLNPQLFHTTFSRNMYRSMLERRAYKDTMLLQTETSFDRLMKDNYTYAFGDFDKGAFNMTFVQDKNKELQEFEYIKTSRINANMLNYVNQETFGFVAANLSVSDYFESYRKVMNSLIESMPLRPEYTASFELIDIFINKDIFYNTFTGDALFAFTGLTTKVENRHKYVMDPETFKREYKEVSDTTLFPEILFMASIAKQENIDRLLLAMEHMGIFKKLKSNVYEVLQEPKGASTSFYVATFNGILFVTNNQNLALKYLETGIPKSNQITGMGKDLLVKYGNCQYWNSNASFDAILKIGTHFRPREQGKIKVLQSHLATSSIYTVRDASSLKTHATLNFSDASINSLSELVNLLHELELTR